MAYNLKIHIRIVHEKIKQFTCDTCSKTFSKKSQLKDHLYRVHTEINAEDLKRCGFCNVGFKLQEGLNKHLKIHESKKSFQCDICEKSFRRQSHLTSHVIEASG